MTEIGKELSNIRILAAVTGEGADRVRIGLEIREKETSSERAIAAEACGFGSEAAARGANREYLIDVSLEADDEIEMPETVIDFRFAPDGIQSVWLPGMLTPAKNIRAKGMLEYSRSVDLMTHICNFAPFGAFYGADGRNRLSFALLECKDPVKLEAGSYMEEECCRVSLRLFTVPSHGMRRYRTTLRIDTALEPVFDSVRRISEWYERELALDAMPVPEAALFPAYSTWYSFLQNISAEKIERQCEIASKIGCRTVIVDDGWQTDDNGRGYAFCGDWEVSKKRFPDFAAHVRRIHDLGMKYVLWLSVPFIGRGTKNYAKFKDCMLNYNPRWGACTLDPRYRKVRDHLVRTYADLVRAYDLDGLKLDFIDEFTMRNAEGKALEFDGERDTQSISEAVDLLMRSVRLELEKIRPDILIEFRQNYVGPMIRCYGNMFRAHDCPNDTLMNRMSTLDLRATSLGTAVHSDMYTISSAESAEGLALNFIHTLFAVPQISPDLTRMSEVQLKTMGHWLRFMTERRDLLLRGRIEVTKPEFCYAQIRAVKGSEELWCESSGGILEIFGGDEIKKSTLVNGAMADSFTVRSRREVRCLVETFDCAGELRRREERTFGRGLSEIAVPKSGYSVLTDLG